MNIVVCNLIRYKDVLGFPVAKSNGQHCLRPTASSKTGIAFRLCLQSVKIGLGSQSQALIVSRSL